MRWLLLLPAAVVAGMAGSLAGGIVASPFGQAAADAGSAFVGPFAFVAAAYLVAPSKRRTVGIGAAAVITLLAMGTFLLSTFTNVEEFANLDERARILTPVAQFLGALYALFIVPPFATPVSLLEDLWREIGSLGVIVGLFGAAFGVIGLIVGLMGRGWFAFVVSLGVLGFAVLTWLFPLVHLSLRVRKLSQHRATPRPPS